MSTHPRFGLGLASILFIACSNDGDGGGSGGQSNTGGKSAFGGSANTGVTKPVGGSTATGGKTGSGGTSNSAGKSATGGLSSSAGASSVGGTSSVGGSTTIAGTSSVGGTQGFAGTSSLAGATAGVAGIAGTLGVAGSSSITPTYSISGKLTGLLDKNNGLELQLLAGNNLVLKTDGTFTFAGGLQDGATYTVKVARQPSDPRQYCKVGNATGKVNANNVDNVSVTCSRLARYNLVVDSVDKSVSSYVIDGKSGRSTYIGKVDTGNAPAAIAVLETAADPNQAYAYVANSGDGSISRYKVHVDGSLEVLGTVSIAAGAGTAAIVVDDSGKYLYAANGGIDSISQYAIATDGTLTSLGTATVPAGTKPTSVALHPSGRFAYVTNSGSSTVSQYSIASGMLSAIGTVESGASPSTVAVDPTGRFAYVGNGGGTSISQFAINPTTGVLSALPTASVQTPAKPTSIAIDPSGTFVYATTFTDATKSSTILQYSIATDGALSALNTTAIPTESGPNSILIEPAGVRVYVSNASGNSVSQFLVDNEGVAAERGGLIANAPPRVSSQTNPVALTMVAGTRYVEPVGENAYVVNGNDTMYLYDVDTTNGGLTAFDTKTLAGAGPQAVVVSPSGKHAYVSNSSSRTISHFTIDTFGGLAEVTPAAATGAFPWALTIHPSGKYLYVTNQTAGTISSFSVDNDGVLKPIGTAPVTVDTTGILIGIVAEASGRFVYVLSNNEIVQYAVGKNGALTALAPLTEATGVNFGAIALAPSAKWIYVVDSDLGKVSQYAVGSNGTLSVPPLATFQAGTSPQAIAIDPLGRYAYVGNVSNADIFQYLIGTSDGGLFAMTPASVAAGIANSDSPNAVAIDPAGEYVYVVNNKSSGSCVWQYSLTARGGLVPMNPPSVATGAYGRSIAIQAGYR